MKEIATYQTMWTISCCFIAAMLVLWYCIYEISNWNFDSKNFSMIKEMQVYLFYCMYFEITNYLKKVLQ